MRSHDEIGFQRTYCLLLQFLTSAWEARAQVAQTQNMSIGEHQHCYVTFEIKGFV